MIELRLEGASLVPTMRKPFDVLAEGLDLSKSRGDKTAIELFLMGFAGWGEPTLSSAPSQG
jgi:hypothetical protein